MTDDRRRLAALQDATLAREAARSLRAFIRLMWGYLEPAQPFVPNWHIDYLVEHLEAVTAGEITRLLINVPPRCMKSLLVSVLWPTWEWIQRPSGRWVFASHSESLAVKHSRDRRTVLLSPTYQRHWPEQGALAPDQNMKEEFHNAHRGVMIATSMRGSITGKGGNRIVIDDPHNSIEAASDVQREAATASFRQAFSTRLDNKKDDAIVVVGQRLAERDLSAFCLDLNYTHVCLPAEAEETTTLVFPRSGRTFRRAPGDLLWSARDGREELAMQKRLLGSAGYSAQYQQRPVPAGGLIFNPTWLRSHDELPPMDEYLQSWDMSYKDTPGGSYVVGLVAGRKGPNVYLIARVKGQWAFTETIRQVEALCRRYPQATTILIEDAANGPAIIDVLSQKFSGVIAVTPQGSKVARAQAVQPMLEAGNVSLPNPTPYGRLLPELAWVEDFRHQLAVFPQGAHDDDVDAFTQLLVRCQRPRRIMSAVW